MNFTTIWIDFGKMLIYKQSENFRIYANVTIIREHFGTSARHCKIPVSKVGLPLICTINLLRFIIN